jgi:hypothetical protein
LLLNGARGGQRQNLCPLFFIREKPAINYFRGNFFPSITAKLFAVAGIFTEVFVINFLGAAIFLPSAR